ncbi:FKBP-type peptidyl-prolyl cis-trans isomerase [Parendozoicomonas haliclonae]|uniref:Peptidyl-prolyl cis-trans isomerase n=1 Tax=Parendozoicomonas haliclonae TaxID=1960125 RepID=A0A1X7AMY1_9GAMM|nr:peptidylprolyl isomerase [Parendozoicomonas haliclonae]SMA49487.1 FKBP-type peptidyl-prolyl cis-trans isomerase SlyD [Parendozoicomonas haliclonae]
MTTDVTDTQTVADNKVVLIHYTLKDDDGAVIDSSEGREPLPYIHGLGTIVEGLENALAGKQVGDKLTVTVEPAEGYGEFDESLVQPVPREQFGDHEVTEGQQFHADTAVGPRIVTVVAIEGDDVIIDANHELAGMNLNFDVEVVEIRDATADELEHGHVHGPGCNH